MRDVEVFIVHEESGLGITINFCEQTNEQIMEVVEHLKDLGYDFDSASEDIFGNGEDDDIIIITIETDEDFSKVSGIVRAIFGEEEDFNEDEEDDDDDDFDFDDDDEDEFWDDFDDEEDDCDEEEEE